MEQLNYQPTRLSEIRWLTRRLVEGRTVPGRKAPIETDVSMPMAAYDARKTMRKGEQR